jgi:hypothetical protein
MGQDREAEVREEMRAVLAKLKVLECALLEVLQGLGKDRAAAVAAGLRARVNEWSLHAGSDFTPLVDEMASEQLTSLLGALDEAPQLPVLLDEPWPPMATPEPRTPQGTAASPAR